MLFRSIIPYDLAWRMLKSRKQKSGGVTIMPYVEIGLLLLAIGAAALTGGEGCFHSPKNVAIFGGLAILISYVHLLVAGIAAGWIVSQLNKRKK